MDVNIDEEITTLEEQIVNVVEKLKCLTSYEDQPLSDKMQKCVWNTYVIISLTKIGLSGEMKKGVQVRKYMIWKSSLPLSVQTSGENSNQWQGNVYQGKM